MVTQAPRVLFSLAPEIISRSDEGSVIKLVRNSGHYSDAGGLLPADIALDVSMSKSGRKFSLQYCWLANGQAYIQQWDDDDCWFRSLSKWLRSNMYMAKFRSCFFPHHFLNQYDFRAQCIRVFKKKIFCISAWVHGLLIIGSNLIKFN